MLFWQQVCLLSESTFEASFVPRAICRSSLWQERLRTLVGTLRKRLLNTCMDTFTHHRTYVRTCALLGIAEAAPQTAIIPTGLVGFPSPWTAICERSILGHLTLNFRERSERQPQLKTPASRPRITSLVRTPSLDHNKYKRGESLLPSPCGDWTQC